MNHVALSQVKAWMQRCFFVDEEPDNSTLILHMVNEKAELKIQRLQRGIVVEVDLCRDLVAVVLDRGPIEGVRKIAAALHSLNIMPITFAKRALFASSELGLVNGFAAFQKKAEQHDANREQGTPLPTAWRHGGGSSALECKADRTPHLSSACRAKRPKPK